MTLYPSATAGKLAFSWLGRTGSFTFLAHYLEIWVRRHLWEVTLAFCPARFLATRGIAPHGREHA
jgi:hypothetical protein